MYFSLQAKVGREKELETTLQRLRGKNADISMESAHIRVKLLTLMFDYRIKRKYMKITLYQWHNTRNEHSIIIVQEYTQTFEMDSKVGIFYLFQRKYAYPLIVSL